MAIDLGLPLWPLQGLGQKNQLMALYCFINLLHLCFLPTAPLEKDAAWGNEGFIASWIMPHMRKGDLKGNSYVRRQPEKSPGPLSAPV